MDADSFSFLVTSCIIRICMKTFLAILHLSIVHIILMSLTFCSHVPQVASQADCNTMDINDCFRNAYRTTYKIIIENIYYDKTDETSRCSLASRELIMSRQSSNLAHYNMHQATCDNIIFSFEAANVVIFSYFCTHVFLCWRASFAGKFWSRFLSTVPFSLSISFGYNGDSIQLCLRLKTGYYRIILAGLQA